MTSELAEEGKGRGRGNEERKAIRQVAQRKRKCQEWELTKMKD